RAQSFGFIDGLAVVVERGPEPDRVSSGKEAAAAVARQGDLAVSQLPCHAGEARARDLIAPGADAADAATGAGLENRRQLEVLAEGRGIGGEMGKARREIAHQAIPCTARTRTMRRRASSGSRNSPARSASRNRSAKCGSERALCCPPTKIKWSCRPLR